MPRPRFETLDPERRRGILANAAESFRLGGLHGASLNDILARTGVSKGVFYYYFDDKKDLYATVVDDAIQRFEAEFESRPALEELEPSSFWGHLEASYRSMYRFAREHAPTVQLLKTLSDLAPEEVDQLGVDARCISWLERFLERGRVLGVVRDDVPMGVLTQLAAAVDTSMGQWLLENAEDGDEMLDQQARQVVEMHRRVLETHVRFSAQEAD